MTRSLTTSVVLVSWLARAVCGNVLAGPYQAIYMWQAYQMEVYDKAGPTDYLAPFCPRGNGLKGGGSGRGGSCTFDQLMSYLSDGKAPPTSVGFGTRVDLEQTVNELRGWDGEVAADRLFPAKFVAGDKENFRYMMTLVRMNIQASRKKSGYLIDGLFKDAKTTLSRAMMARIADQGEASLRFLDGQLAAQGIPWQVERRVRSSRGQDDWLEPDFEKTISEHPEPHWQEVVDYVNTFRENNGEYQRHQRIIGYLQSDHFKLWEC